MSEPVSCETDPFEALNLEPCFRLDLEALERAYLNAQQRIHPDRLQNNLLAQQVATRLSSQMTHAYHTLKSPLGRAEMMLRRYQSWPLPPVEACAPDLLEEMMELQEQAAASQHDPDPSQPQAFATALETMCRQAEEQLGAMLVPEADPAEGAGRAYHRLSFLLNLEKRFQEALRG